MDSYDWLLFGTRDEEPQDVKVEVRELDEPDDLDDIGQNNFYGPLYSPDIDIAGRKTLATRGRSTMAAGGASPSSSPRLPSPPPFTEVQIGPKSPTVSDSFGNVNEKLPEDGSEAAQGSIRRIRPGTSASEMAAGPPLVPLSQLDSPFQLQEHLKALYQNYTCPDNSSTILPITREIAQELAEPPEGVERSLWLYELCRFLTMKANNIIVAFFSENPPCSAQTCPEMRASEWQYLCAVHDPPKSCCAIDYCCHTLDWATNILTSPKYFPSRLTLGSEAGGGPQASMKHLTNIFRRLYRIFAHAWFQHRDVFWQVEGHDGLYVFFKTVCDVYNLIPEDNYTIPAEAEGVDEEDATKDERADARKVTLLQRDRDPTKNETAEPSSMNLGATTRRHKHTPSTGASVGTISEGVEEGTEEGENKKLPNLEEDSVLELPKVTEQDVDKVEPDTQELPITNGVPIEIMPEEENGSKEEASGEKPDPADETTTQMVTSEPEPAEAQGEKSEAESNENDVSDEKKEAEDDATNDDDKTGEVAETPAEPKSETTETEPSEAPAPSTSTAVSTESSDPSPKET